MREQIEKLQAKARAEIKQASEMSDMRMNEGSPHLAQFWEGVKVGYRDVLNETAKMLAEVTCPDEAGHTMHGRCSTCGRVGR